MDSLKKYQKEVQMRAWAQLNKRKDFFRKPQVQKWLQRIWAAIIIGGVVGMYCSLSHKMNKEIALAMDAKNILAEMQLQLKNLGQYQDVALMSEEQFNDLLKVKTGLKSWDASVVK
jgi:hypothetical protein